MVISNELFNIKKLTISSHAPLVYPMWCEHCDHVVMQPTTR